MKLKGLARWVWTNLTMRYLIGLGTIGVLASIAQFYVQKILRTTEADHRTSILLESRSLKAQYFSDLLKRIASSASVSERRRVLREAFDVDEQLSAIDHKMIELSKKSHAKHLVDRMLQIVEERKQIKEKLESAAGRLNGRAQIQEAIGRNRESIDAFMQYSIDLQFEQARRLSRLQRVEYAIFALILILLLLEIFLVFRPAVTMMSRTVGELERAQKELLQQKEKTEQLLGIRSEFIGRMSHEIRNPLNTVQGMVDLLIETSKDSEQKRYLQIMRRATRTLLTFMNDILDFSKMDRGEVELQWAEFDVLPVIETVADLVATQAHEKGLQIVIDISARRSITVLGDKKRFQQVLLNLLQNAVKFTDRGFIQIGAVWYEHERRAEFFVMDTGIGIPDELKGKIFESFYQADTSRTRKAGGAGLGLSISRKLIERMKGKIWVEANPSGGSIFRFDLPGVRYASAGTGLNTIQSVTLVSDPSPLAEVLLKRMKEAYPSVERIDDFGQIVERLKIGEPIASEALIFDEEIRGLSTIQMLQKSLGDLKKIFSERKAALMVSLTNAQSALEECQRSGIHVLFKPLKPSEVEEFFSGNSSTLREQAEEAIADGSLSSLHEQGAAPLRDKRVLVVDDTPENHLVIEAFLKPWAMEIEHAYDGEQAVEMLRARAYDLVLMDIQMPKMDGYEATRILRKHERLHRKKTLPVVAVTALDDPLELRLAKEAGCTDRLTKPVSQESLMRVVMQAFGFRSEDLKVKGAPMRSAVRSESKNQNGGAVFDIALDSVHPAIRSAVPAYVEKRFAELVELQRLMDEANWTELQRSGHKLRGNAATYGFPGLTVLGERLERCARDAQAAEIAAILADMRPGYALDASWALMDIAEGGTPERLPGIG